MLRMLRNLGVSRWLLSPEAADQDIQEEEGDFGMGSRVCYLGGFTKG
jgi:hypothetical protein